MPVYEFICDECGNVFSEIRKIGDFSVGNCEKCGSSRVKKMISTFLNATLGASCTPSGGG
ncbi:MAG: zinc ribbon domain-containing protein [Spirochaetes bacterium]|nr:MAG: zinc ribbon domain-containing protein [Spirochaetota bacterium]